MENFIGEVTDTPIIKNPVGTWQYAKNILLSKEFKSIVNENGFLYSYLVPGIIIGQIETNYEVVYMSKTHNGMCEIGRVKDITTDNPYYQTDIRTNLFNFQLNCPIEGIFMYNYKKELIIAFCDGTFDNSNSPKLVNLDNPSVSLGSTSKNLLNAGEFTKLKLFPDIKEGGIELEYLEGGNIDGLVAYITYAYVFDDNSNTSYFSSNTLAYLGEGFDPVNKKGVKIKFTNLDPNYNKIKLGIVLKREGALFGYESYNISYTGTGKEISITSLTNYITANPESIILEKSIFDRIETMTKYENQSIVAKTVTKDKIAFQKYANLLTLKPYKYYDKNPQTPSLPPDEVISFYIQLQRLDGSYTEGFHIPGRAAINTERSDLSSGQISAYELDWAEDIGLVKQFHIINTGLVTESGSTARFGYWENEELYPNTEDYNSINDYNGNSLSSIDLRNTPIRYHRMPSLQSFVGVDEGLGIANSGNLDETQFYKLAVLVTNFNSVVPSSIKSQIQGYRLCMVKRNFGNSLVLGNWIMTRRHEIEWTQSQVDIKWDSYNFNTGFYENAYTEPVNMNFTKGALLATELFKFKPSLNISYIQVNYLINTLGTGNSAKQNVQLSERFAKVKNNLKYRLSNNLTDRTQYHEEIIDIEIDKENYIYRDDINSTPSIQKYYVANITGFSFKTNVYSGFKSNDLIVLEKTNRISSANVLFRGGDVFNTNELNVIVHTPKRFRYFSGDESVAQSTISIKIKGLFGPLNFAQLYNEPSDSVTLYTIGDNNDPDRIQEEYLNSRDYDFEVKHEEDLSTLNDINTILTFDFEDIFINYFPFRINRGIKIPNESLSANALRTYLTSDYYEMPNDKGNIVAIRGKERALFIQMEFTLFVASIKDKLKTEGEDTYLGDSDLFERRPDEIMGGEKGYVGCSSKFSARILKGAYVVIDQIEGKIFYFKDNIEEISGHGKRIFFENNADTGLKYYRTDYTGEIIRVDNPYISVGHLTTLDIRNNRLLFIKKDYQFLRKDLIDSGTIIFDGEFYKFSNTNSIIDFNNSLYFKDNSYTYSFSLDSGQWICPHDYKPNIINYGGNKIFSGINNLETESCSMYLHNSPYSKGLFYDKQYPSYVDIIFNGYIEVSKLLQNLTWVTETINENNVTERHKTITHIMIYNNTQCSGLINLKDNMFELTRNVKDEFNFNEFRDLVKNETLPIILDNGDLNTVNIDNKKLWFEKSNFIGKFIVVRLYIDNITNDTTIIHEVSAKSIKKGSR